MSAIILAATLAVAAPARPACAPNPPKPALAPRLVNPHPLAQEPSAKVLHAVLRVVDGCTLLDVRKVDTNGRPVWTQAFSGAAPTVARPAGR